VDQALRKMPHDVCCNDNDNDNDKRQGLTAKADQPDHKKIQYTKNKY